VLLSKDSTFLFLTTVSLTAIRQGVIKWEKCWFAVISSKESTHAFIVRIWIEPREINGAEPIWRGVIEQVEGDARLHFDRLDKLCSYLAGFLESVGMKTSDPS
jgi:hypothetical protein